MDGRQQTFGVIAGEGASVGDIDVQRGGRGFGEAGGVDDVGEEAVVAGRNGGECEFEVAGGDLLGVQVEGNVHGRPADDVQVHQVVVVEDEVVETAGGENFLHDSGRA